MTGTEKDDRSQAVAFTDYSGSTILRTWGGVIITRTTVINAGGCLRPGEGEAQAQHAMARLLTALGISHAAMFCDDTSTAARLKINWARRDTPCSRRAHSIATRIRHELLGWTVPDGEAQLHPAWSLTEAQDQQLHRIAIEATSGKELKISDLDRWVRSSGGSLEAPVFLSMQAALSETLQAGGKSVAIHSRSMGKKRLVTIQLDGRRVLEFSVKAKAGSRHLQKKVIEVEQGRTGLARSEIEHLARLTSMVVLKQLPSQDQADGVEGGTTSTMPGAATAGQIHAPQEIKLKIMHQVLRNSKKHRWPASVVMMGDQALTQVACRRSEQPMSASACSDHLREALESRRLRIEEEALERFGTAMSAHLSRRPSDRDPKRRMDHQNEAIVQSLL